MIILLMGPPGSGKTSIGKRLSQHLNYFWIDVDNHVLQPEWQCSVADKLMELGDKSFLEEEARTLKEAVSTFTFSTIISLTGSNPMDLSVMQALRSLKNAIFIYLDVHLDDIVKRLDQMKVDRIVGNSNLVEMGMKELIDRRSVYYDPWYDLRVWPREGATIEDIAEDVLERIDEYLKAYCDIYTSTRCTVAPRPLNCFATTWNLSQVVLSGLARDGGLYVPKHPLPKPTFGQLKRLVPLSYKHKGHIVMEKLIHHSQISPQKLDASVDLAFESFSNTCVVPITYLPKQDIYLAELFHGPTGSFKDLALQLLPRLVSKLLLPHERNLYLVATSGDTGGAVIDGFSRLSEEQKKRLGVFVMYPTDGISKIQRQQMVTCESPNVKVLGIDGNFDDCQRIVKSLLSDQTLKKKLLKNHSVVLNTANSINWGRILPQILFHMHDYLELVNRGFIELGQKVDLCIPTGNFGNILSSIYAKEMGIPYDQIICASNDNKVLHDFFTTGIYDLRDRYLHKTISPAIDILISSNIERLLWTHFGPFRVKELMKNLAEEKYFQIFPDELEQLKSKINLRSGWCNQKNCKETIKEVWNQDKYMVDPHTAVAIKVSKEFKTSGGNPMLVTSTAHYSKFVDECSEIFSDQNIEAPALHENIEKCKKKNIVHQDCVMANYDAVSYELTNFIKCYFDQY